MIILRRWHDENQPEEVTSKFQSSSRVYDAARNDGRIFFYLIERDRPSPEGCEHVRPFFWSECTEISRKDSFWPE